MCCSHSQYLCGTAQCEGRVLTESTESRARKYRIARLAFQAELRGTTVEPSGKLESAQVRPCAKTEGCSEYCPTGAIAPIAREALVGDRAHAHHAPIDMPRGWLMRRLLLVADVIGLMSAFLIALALGPATPIGDRVNVWWEVALFVASLPLWVFLVRAHSLYDRDEERSDHSTVDDIFGVFQVVTIGTWSFLAITQLAGLPHPSVPRLVIFWLTAILLLLSPSGHTHRRPTSPGLRAECDHRRFGGCGAAPRQQDPPAPRIPPQRRRLRRWGSRRVLQRNRSARADRPDRAISPSSCGRTLRIASSLRSRMTRTSRPSR